jgi:hypothetical protein
MNGISMLVYDGRRNIPQSDGTTISIGPTKGEVMNGTPDTEVTEVKSSAVADSLRKTLRLLVIATIVLYLVMVGIGIKIWQDGKATTDALCTYRADLITRVNASIAFLSEHPDGLPEAGVTAKSISDGINNQQHAILALADLNCSEPTPDFKQTSPKETP